MNIADAESSFLKGTVTFKQWKDRFELRWTAPLTLSLLGAALESAGPVNNTRLREMSPEAFDETMKILGKRG